MKELTNQSFHGRACQGRGGLKLRKWWDAWLTNTAKKVTEPHHITNTPFDKDSVEYMSSPAHGAFQIVHLLKYFKLLSSPLAWLMTQWLLQHTAPF